MKLSIITTLLGLVLTASSAVQATPAIPSQLTTDEITRISKLSRAEKLAFAEKILEIRTAYEYEKQHGGALLHKRASPSGSFAPANMACPQRTSQQAPGFIRDANTKQLSNGEADYISRRRQNTRSGWQKWLSQAKLDSVLPGGASNYTSDTDRLPRLGFALSGGGLRAMLVGAGTLQGFDGRNETANSRGTGGLLQLAEYVAGLSGGSWATASLSMNNWATTQSLKDSIWNLESNLVVPKDGKVSFYASILAAVAGKRTEGYQTSLTDYFGLSIADKILNGSTYGNKYSVEWSDVKNTSSFTDASMPFPIIIADEREPDELIIPRNTTIWEFNPYEFGSWNPNVSAFIPIEILGSSLNNGSSESEGVVGRAVGRCWAAMERGGWNEDPEPKCDEADEGEHSDHQNGVNGMDVDGSDVEGSMHHGGEQGNGASAVFGSITDNPALSHLDKLFVTKQGLAIPRLDDMGQPIFVPASPATQAARAHSGLAEEAANEAVIETTMLPAPEQRSIVLAALECLLTSMVSTAQM